MEEKESLFKAGLNTGLILGVISAILTFLIYFVNPNTLASGTYGFGLLAVFTVLAIILGIRYRKSIGGYISFGKAYKFSIITFVVMILIGVVTSILLFLVIDPALPERLAEQTIENTLAVMEKFGAADALSEEQIDEMRDGIIEGYTVFGIIKANLMSIIFYGILSLVVAGIVKKKDKSLEY
jgi:hypothetical protein